MDTAPGVEAFTNIAFQLTPRQSRLARPAVTCDLGAVDTGELNEV